MIIIKVMLVIFVLLLVFHLVTKKYLNPYKLIMVFGKKGSGKSTFQTKVALDYAKKGWTVYCTTKLPCTYYVPVELVGKVEFKPNSVLFIDEVGMIWDNRNFKNFDTETRDWFKLQRHRKVKVYLFSQSFDIDKKIRDLVDEMYLLNKCFRVFSIAKRISRTITITKATDTNGSQLADQLQFDSILWFWCGSRKLTFIPRYVKYFDSYYAPKLKDYNFEYMPVSQVKRGNKKYINLKIDKEKLNRRFKLCYIKSKVFKMLTILTKREEK